jgi:serine/threonine protein kinase
VAKPAIQTFGKYQILERIATGGMAEIYKARLEGIGGFQRTFAIKRILPNLSQNSEYIAMLVDEAKVAGLLSHANIVQILDLGQVDGIWYIAMEYVHGRDLGAVLRRAKKKGLCLPVPHTVFVAIELLKGLEYAHHRQVMRGGRPVALNIIHRDVSPPNVLLSFQGEVKLTDFGIARASLKAMETVSGIVKGRFDYMSPEQAAGSKDLDQRSDLFSVGVVLYEMLTGHHPFRTDNEIGTIERVRTGNYVPVNQRNAEVPFTLESIVDRALQVNRDDRFPTATAFKEALDKFFHDAGFIFTHATLASYVRGLFPEASSRSTKASTPPGAPSTAETLRNPTTGKVNRPRDATPSGLDRAPPAPDGGDEGPTRRLDRKKLADSRSPMSQDRRTDGGRSDEGKSRPSPLADLLKPGGDENETIIRNKLTPNWDDDPATQLKSKDALDENETIIRKGGFDESPRGTGRAPTPEVTFSGSTGTGRRTGSGRKKPLLRGPWWAPWAAAGVGLALGVGVGVVMSSVAAGASLIASWGLTSGPVVEAKAPTIEVQALNASQTQILIDGEAVGPQTAVEPDKVHRLEVDLKGYQPWTTDVKLGLGETRVFVVKPVDLQPVTPKK